MAAGKGGRIAVKVVAGNHTHDGRPCKRGDVIHLRPSQVQWMGSRVQRVKAPDPKPAPEPVAAVPDAPDDTPASGADDSDDDEDPARRGSSLDTFLDQANDSLSTLGLSLNRGREP